MNKDRAIQLLERMQNPEPYDPQITSEAFDAIQMAIDALSADGDTISRKAAIDALVAETIYTKEELRKYYEANSHRNEWVNGIYEAVEVIEQLPPAQPTFNARDTQYNLPIGMDCISRQAAIKILHEALDAADQIAYVPFGVYQDYRDKMNELPPANTSETPNSSDTISRQQAIDAVDSETVSTNPEHFKSSEKFIKFMDDTDIASFGKWQWANGFNTALVATTIQLKKLPSAQPEIVRCKDCKYWHSGSCEYTEHTVNSQDYMIGDIETEAEHFCGYAEKREVTT